MSEQFTWIEIYSELANVLDKWEERQTELIDFLATLRDEGYPVTPMNDKNKDGERFRIQEVDPFSFLAVFNRQITDDNRIAILRKIKQKFQLQSPLPTDFNGVPVVNNQSSWFIAYQPSRQIDDVSTLWKIFHLALQPTPLQNSQFVQLFDKAMGINRVNINLTMGLFWIRPDTFLNLDKVNREYLNIELPRGGLTADFYLSCLQEIGRQEIPFFQLSYSAWLAAQKSAQSVATKKVSQLTDKIGKERNYWLVGAYWNDYEPADQTQRFIEEGIWKNGYTDRYQDEVNEMKPNDKIAIKAATTQRNDLPFDAQGNTVSRMDIKAIGTIVDNWGDGQTVSVEWDTDFETKSWYFYTNRNTIWRLKTGSDYRFPEHVQRLIDFVWGGGAQDYEWYVSQWWHNEEENEPLIIAENAPVYGLEDLLAGVFLEPAQVAQIMARLQSKKAVILQGTPGVGKTFIARRLAYALMQAKDLERMEMVQFHQSYSYDDFVRGYRPDLQNGHGGFSLRDGIFYEFCEKARQDPEQDYVFIIDEINRGNLSLIFGELLMLIEADKRGKEFAVPLVYRTNQDERFYIPANVYLIGLMNVADRSLAMVDYALRRRFAFVDLPPQYGSPRFHKWLADRYMSDALIDLISTRMGSLNEEIATDPLLGMNYRIGHSYFCPRGDDFSALNEDWYRGIIETEIAPLLREYWFDNLSKAEDAIKRLRA